jgi:hypothetical protein
VLEILRQLGGPDEAARQARITRDEQQGIAAEQINNSPDTFF